MAVTYTLYIEPEVHAAREKLPGHMRQRIRRTIETFVQNPRPAGSRALDTSTLDLPPEVEIRRLRIESWRLVYAIHATDSWVWILGLQRRPPYDYADLPDLAQKLRT
jgi:mRNA-degrading endonuclease RelE of RelBE toxin-antitoxin system